MAVLELTQNKT